MLEFCVVNVTAASQHTAHSDAYEEVRLNTETSPRNTTHQTSSKLAVSCFGSESVRFYCLISFLTGQDRREVQAEPGRKTTTVPRTQAEVSRATHSATAYNHSEMPQTHHQRSVQ